MILNLTDHEEPSNGIKDFFQDPANHPAITEAVLLTIQGEAPVHSPGAFHMLPNQVRQHFIRVFDAENGNGRERGILGLEFIERISAYYPGAYSRKASRGPRCQDLAEHILNYLTK